MEDGSCALLTEDNRCAIYEDRPDICRIDAGAKSSGMDIEEYYRLNAVMCNTFMEQDGMTDKFISITILGDTR